MISKLPQNIDRFYVSKNEYFFAQTKDLLLNFVYSCYYLDIFFYSGNNIILFGNEDAGSFCSTIQSKVPKLLQKKDILPLDLKNILGKSKNDYFMGLSEDDRSMDYHFFGNSHTRLRPYFNSWLYNDAQGNIIFEITPAYPWNDEDEHDIQHPEFVSYQEFMKNYKPTLVRVVDPIYLQQWLDQVNILHPLFEKNELIDLHQDEH